MAVTTRKGSLPHVEWIDLKNNGILVECAVMKRDEFGNISFIDITGLDQIDKGRLSRILMNRNVANFQLWDLMSQLTLNNGVNALQYFHQLVKVITPTGVIMNPRAGQVGTGRFNTNDAVQVAAAQMNNAPVESLPETTKAPRAPRAPKASE